jgi:hypothetical protein
MQVTSSPSSYVLPHHCVTKSTSSTLTVRIVFNGSAVDSSGKSLNDRLYAGPKLQSDLSHILFSFRLHAFALCADIKMMYRQIL